MATAVIDFVVDTAGPLTMVVAMSPAAEDWAAREFVRFSRRWPILGVWLLEPDSADMLLRDAVRTGELTLRVDGHLVKPRTNFLIS